MSKMHELHAMEGALSRHVKEGHGKETEKSLDLKANRQERLYQHDHELHKLYARAGDKDKKSYFAETRDRAGDKATKYARMSDDMHSARHLIKKYGEGHDTASLGEGKPYGET